MSYYAMLMSALHRQGHVDHNLIDRAWSKETLWEVMIACVVMHNMIVEEVRDDNVYGHGWEFPSCASYNAR
jgi:hypothetical protein